MKKEDLIIGQEYSDFHGDKYELAVIGCDGEYVHLKKNGCDYLFTKSMNEFLEKFKPVIYTEENKDDKFDHSKNKTFVDVCCDLILNYK